MRACLARDEFLDEERLNHVIVGAAVQAFDALPEFRTSGDQQDGDGVGLLAQVLQDTEAVAAALDEESLLFEPFADEARNAGFVFYHQDFHNGSIAWCAGGEPAGKIKNS